MSLCLARAMLGLLLVGLAACAGTPGTFAVWGPQTRPQAGGRMPVVPGPAPAAGAPVQPAQGGSWTPGYWRWENNRYQWVEAHWSGGAPGRPPDGQQWQVGGNGQWRLEGGTWRRD